MTELGWRDAARRRSKRVSGLAELEPGERHDALAVLVGRPLRGLTMPA